MPTDDAPNRIFVVGSPRSGTTLVQALLSLHPAIFCFTETELMGVLPPRSVDDVRPTRHGDVKRMLRLWRFLTSGLRARRRLARAIRSMDLPESSQRAAHDLPVAPLSRRRLVLQTIKAMDRIAADADKSIWAEKTPWHLHYLSDILAADPQARIIHVVRRGTDVVASGYELLTRHGGWGTSRAQQRRCVDAAIARWAQDVAATAPWQDSPNHLVVRYESLVEQPQAFLDAFGEFLEMDFEPAMPLDLSRAPDYLAQGPWNVVSPTIIDNSGNKFETLFDAQMKRYVHDRIAAIQEAAGLSVSTFDTPVGTPC